MVKTLASLETVVNVMILYKTHFNVKMKEWSLMATGKQSSPNSNEAWIQTGKQDFKHKLLYTYTENKKMLQYNFVTLLQFLYSCLYSE